MGWLLRLLAFRCGILHAWITIVQDLRAKAQSSYLHAKPCWYTRREYTFKACMDNKYVGFEGKNSINISWCKALLVHREGVYVQMSVTLVPLLRRLSAFNGTTLMRMRQLLASSPWITWQKFFYRRPAKFSVTISAFDIRILNAMVRLKCKSHLLGCLRCWMRGVSSKTTWTPESQSFTLGLRYSAMYGKVSRCLQHLLIPLQDSYKINGLESCNNTG